MSKDSIVSLEHTVVVAATVGVVFERWDRAEDFPKFMEGVREIYWLDEKRFSLKSESGGTLFESICEVVLRIPGKRLAWRTLSGPDSSGVACFEKSGADCTEVTLKMRFDPETGWQDREEVELRMRRNLERFKELLETAAAPSAR